MKKIAGVINHIKRQKKITNGMITNYQNYMPENITLECTDDTKELLVSLEAFNWYVFGNIVKVIAAIISSIIGSFIIYREGKNILNEYRYYTSRKGNIETALMGESIVRFNNSGYSRFALNEIDKDLTLYVKQHFNDLTCEYIIGTNPVFYNAITFCIQVTTLMEDISKSVLSKKTVSDMEKDSVNFINKFQKTDFMKDVETIRGKSIDNFMLEETSEVIKKEIAKLFAEKQTLSKSKEVELKPGQIWMFVMGYTRFQVGYRKYVTPEEYESTQVNFDKACKNLLAVCETVIKQTTNGTYEKDKKVTTEEDKTKLIRLFTFYKNIIMASKKVPDLFTLINKEEAIISKMFTHVLTLQAKY